jgi:hypothetical protein
MKIQNGGRFGTQRENNVRSGERRERRRTGKLARNSLLRKNKKSLI